MTKSINIFTALLFIAGILIIILNSGITGAVTGKPTDEFSYLFIVLGIFFILTSLIFFVTSHFKAPYIYGPEDDHPTDYEDLDEKDINFDSRARSKPLKKL